jgi:osmoprotectant transport system permease protein
VSAVLPAFLSASLLAAPVQVGSKDFGESRLLGEIFSQALEARGVAVTRRLGLAGSDVAFQALRQGSLDVYPEYSGTLLYSVLHLAPAPGDARAEDARLGELLAREYQLLWLPSLGFSNGWVLAVPRALASRDHLVTLSDLARRSAEAPSLSAAFSPEFLGRRDGLPGLTEAYGLHLDGARPMAQPIKYAAVTSGAVNVIDAYATDGRLAALGLVPLEDDRHFFPGYDAAPLVRADLAARSPSALAALLSLRGRLDADSMRRLNRQVEEGRAPSEVAAEWLRTEGLRGGKPSEQATAAKGFLGYAWDRRRYLGALLLRHLELTGAALLLASIVGFALGLLSSRSRAAAAIALKSTALLQTIPGLALLAFLVPWLGIGAWPALVALFVYALLPIVQATYAGLRGVDPELVDVAVGMGMTEGQVLFRLRLPPAAGVVISGLRTAAVIAVGTATLAAFVGGGGLGEAIVAGLTLNDPRLILLGAIPAALLALLVDWLLAVLEAAVSPRP